MLRMAGAQLQIVGEKPCAVLCTFSTDSEMKNMDQIVMSDTTSSARRRAARLAKGYSLEDLAIATGLTVAEITAAEEAGVQVPEHHVERIEHVLA